MQFTPNCFPHADPFIKVTDFSRLCLFWNFYLFILGGVSQVESHTWCVFFPLLDFHIVSPPKLLKAPTSFFLPGWAPLLLSKLRYFIFVFLLLFFHCSNWSQDFSLVQAHHILIIWALTLECFCQHSPSWKSTAYFHLLSHKSNASPPYIAHLERNQHKCTISKPRGNFIFRVLQRLFFFFFFLTFCYPCSKSGFLTYLLSKHLY